ncbi:angiopoietin-related protein 6-like [Wyeomyia smithii]|uniref:angiopoietin-related protein 6-like n=1 Tax=Wyeomyia smithii TaxID=174621 RepID=UPI002467F53F|nr:angiopoietin-related protein 6-like [Wyeomyia smithii]XP_055528521.1 angiopoietin-related protein 6-like [Wyeomyia smithii]
MGSRRANLFFMAIVGLGWPWPPFLDSAKVYPLIGDSIAARMNQTESRMMNRLEELIAEMEKKLERKLGQQMMAQQNKIIEKVADLKKTVTQNSGAYFDSCRTVPSEFSNVFMIRPSGVDTQPFMAYCEQNFLGGGWIVIHRRFNGTVNFTRSWEEYRDGFGEPDGEHWMGLDKIYKITRSAKYELLVVLKDFDGIGKIAHYDGFSVDSEGAKYKLRLGNYDHGNAEDSLSASNGTKFSTYDQDNDHHSDSCAGFFKSGWWFSDCMNANLNGPYNQYEKNNLTMNWFGFRKDLQGLKEASMMIREKV